MNAAFAEVASTKFGTTFVSAAMAEVAFTKEVVRTVGKNHQAQGFRRICEAACPDSKELRMDICTALAKQGMIEYGFTKILADPTT